MRMPILMRIGFALVPVAVGVFVVGILCGVVEVCSPETSLKFFAVGMAMLMVAAVLAWSWILTEE